MQVTAKAAGQSEQKNLGHAPEEQPTRMEFREETCPTLAGEGLQDAAVA
jgi:hypothetical protein